MRHFTGWLHRSPDTASAEDLRRYQLHCVDRGVSPITLNATITGLKFFFEVTMSRPELMAKMRPVRVARTLPMILSREEASRLIESARTLKHRTALSVAYGAGLRVSEVVALKVGDIDSTRMVLRVEQGKGRTMACSPMRTASKTSPRHVRCCRDPRHTFMPIPIQHRHRTDPLDPRSGAGTAGHRCSSSRPSSVRSTSARRPP